MTSCPEESVELQQPVSQRQAYGRAGNIERVLQARQTSFVCDLVRCYDWRF